MNKKNTSNVIQFVTARVQQEPTDPAVVTIEKELGQVVMALTQKLSLLRDQCQFVVKNDLGHGRRDSDEVEIKVTHFTGVKSMVFKIVRAAMYSRSLRAALPISKHPPRIEIEVTSKTEVESRLPAMIKTTVTEAMKYVLIPDGQTQLLQQVDEIFVFLKDMESKVDLWHEPVEQ